MQPHILPTEDLACIYRFAALLAGSPAAAQAAVLETLADAGDKIHHFRSGKSCKAWLVTKVRSRLAKQEPAKEADGQKIDGNISSSTTGDLTPDAIALVARFSKLAEPGRSALALLYLDHFSAQEIAQILQMTSEELSDAAEAARSQLRGVEAAQQPAPAVQQEELP